MPDRIALPLLALIALAMIALALVWPQGQGSRSPGALGRPMTTASPKAPTPPAPPPSAPKPSP